MGMSLLNRSCSTNYTSTPAPAPDPNPNRWELLHVAQFAHAYVLTVRYLDATNFEGVKVMVYRGRWTTRNPPPLLDPHFADSPDSPIARFRPDEVGHAMAEALARALKAEPPPYEAWESKR